MDMPGSATTPGRWEWPRRHALCWLFWAPCPGVGMPVQLEAAVLLSGKPLRLHTWQQCTTLAMQSSTSMCLEATRTSCIRARVHLPHNGAMPRSYRAAAEALGRVCRRGRTARTWAAQPGIAWPISVTRWPSSAELRPQLVCCDKCSSVLYIADSVSREFCVRNLFVSAQQITSANCYGTQCMVAISGCIRGVP